MFQWFLVTGTEQIYCKESPVTEQLPVAASALSLSFAYKTSAFSEITSYPRIFLSLKILPMERSSDSQS